MREPTAPVAAVLRLGAVLAASGPVILTAFGAGRQSVGWFCAATSSAPFPMEGPYTLEYVPGELLFWGVLLLPVVVAGLFLRGSRRAVLTAVAAVGTVLAFGLVTALLLPGPDPCTGQERAVVLPWPLIVCYPVAAWALLLAARSPLSRRQHGAILWAGAVGAAALAAMFTRFTVIYPREFRATYFMISESSWNGLAWWSGTADRIGLPVVLVALAAATKATASTRWERLAGTAAATALLLFPLLDVATYISEYGGDWEIPFADSIRWPLLLAAVLVASAVWRPWVRISWAGTAHVARSMIGGRTKELAVAAVIVAAGVWLVVSSFTPTR
ncbi:hypothetical protein [Nonomuraea sp. NPDC049750]|uniref:hypothetical protein n=1 Tax=Nonomuraea sp. NPDC049750 TaxID=3154738 RepID=UPI0033D55C81